MPASDVGEAAFCAALLDSSRPCPAGLRAWNGSDPGARFAVHRNNVVGSLVDALADTFAVVQELIGEEFFRAMAQRFVRQSPPRSRILAQYGDTFAEFIAQFAPAASVPYLSDIASLEWARVRAFHAADAEPLAHDSVREALASGERIVRLRLVCHPSVGIVRSRFAVVSVWAAHQGDADFGAVDPFQPEDALVVRQGLDVSVVLLPPGVAEFASALDRGAAFGEACAEAAGLHGGFELSAALTLLLGHGAIASIHLPQEEHPE